MGTALPKWASTLFREVASQRVRVKSRLSAFCVAAPGPAGWPTAISSLGRNGGLDPGEVEQGLEAASAGRRRRRLSGLPLTGKRVEPAVPCRSIIGVGGEMGDLAGGQAEAHRQATLPSGSGHRHWKTA